MLAIIDPRPDPGTRVESELARAGLTVQHHTDEILAVAKVAVHPVNAVVLCVRRPSDALGSVVSALRGELGLPVLLGWDVHLLEVAAAAILAGAHPVLSVPLEAAEILGRLPGVWPTRPSAARLIRAGELTIDPGAFDVRLRGRPVDVSKAETAVLARLARNVDRILPHDHFYGLWPTSADPDHALVRAIARLRDSLARAGAPGAIETVRGIGYRLVATPLLDPDVLRRADRAPESTGVDARRILHR